jgi:hypothetical protein
LDGSCHQNPIGDYLGGILVEFMFHPISSLPIYIDQGWAEGLGIMGEKVTVKLGVGPRP